MDNETGQSLVEVIVASTVGIFVVAALTFATIFSLRNANFAKTSSQATKLAQEGIESVRAGRDRNSSITGNFQIGGSIITSWNGDNNGTGAIWGYQIDGNCGNIVPTPPTAPTYCYFNINTAGSLQYLTEAASIPSGAEPIAPNFRRVVILSDDAADYTAQKKVTVIVTWTDFSCGTTPNCHESRLVTILRKL